MGVTRGGRRGPGDRLELLERQIEAINRFPDQNPHPVMRISDDGKLLYANPASAPIVETLGARVGRRLRGELVAEMKRTAADPSAPDIEIVCDLRTYSIRCVSVPDLGVYNLYGTDVTATKLVHKFPDQNPNAVFRVTDDGRLLYANAASAPLLPAIGGAVGELLPRELFERILHAADRAVGERLELHSEGRTFELKPVHVPEFEFTNVYGTDVTAAREVERASAENERLLLNILPAPIADRLRRGERVIADRFEDVTLLFADIVDFTTLSRDMPAVEVVALLNRMFSLFDEMVDRFGLEKIKTIGDAYMVVGGLPEATEDHAERVAEMALYLREEVDRRHAQDRHRITFRIGMHVGPAVAGVIGAKKFIYDVWGDTVNTASRMESHGVPGQIQVTQPVYERLRDRYAFEYRGIVDVKGKGPMPTYFLLGRLPARPGIVQPGPERTIAG